MIFKLDIGESSSPEVFAEKTSDETLRILKSIEAFQEQVRSGECEIENDTQQKMFDLDLRSVDIRAFRLDDRLCSEVV